MGNLQPWPKVLTNTDELIHLLVDRVESDYVSLSVRMRKPWSKEVETRFKVMFHMVQNNLIKLCVSPQPHDSGSTQCLIH